MRGAAAPPVLSDKLTAGVCFQDILAPTCARCTANHRGYSCCTLEAEEVGNHAVLTQPPVDVDRSVNYRGGRGQWFDDRFVLSIGERSSRGGRSADCPRV